MLGRSGVAHSEQGMSKKRFCIAAGPLECNHRYLGYACHVRPWDAPNSLEALEARMGAITLPWGGYNNSQERIVTQG